MHYGEFTFWHWAFVGVVTLIAFFMVSEWFEDGAFGGFFALFILVVVASIATTMANEFTPSEDVADEAQTRREELARQERQKPRKFNEFDGCTLYSFEDKEGRENFITRCPDRTTTESKHTRRQGKVTFTDNKTIETIYE